jgi:phosphoribosylamine--glycine ligase
MLTSSGPKVLEYNARFGDPETQVVLPRLDGDVAALLAEAAAGELSTVPSFRSDVAVTVVGATAGYPSAPRTGDAIAGVEAASAMDGVTVYCAGVTAGPDGGLLTAGGRVLAVTALGRDHDRARRRAYDALDRIRWDGRQFRTDIARDVA